MYTYIKVYYSQGRLTVYYFSRFLVRSFSLSLSFFSSSLNSFRPPTISRRRGGLPSSSYLSRSLSLIHTLFIPSLCISLSLLSALIHPLRLSLPRTNLHPHSVVLDVKSSKQRGNALPASRGLSIICIFCWFKFKNGRRTLGEVKARPGMSSESVTEHRGRRTTTF